MMESVMKQNNETNHYYFCRLARRRYSVLEMARLLNTTVEDVMCARGDWFLTLEERARCLRCIGLTYGETGGE
jgi:hypothetical protein